MDQHVSVSSWVHPQTHTPVLGGSHSPFCDRDDLSISPSAFQTCVSLNPLLRSNRELLCFYLQYDLCWLRLRCFLFQKTCFQVLQLPLKVIKVTFISPNSNICKQQTHSSSKMGIDQRPQMFPTQYHKTNCDCRTMGTTILLWSPPEHKGQAEHTM